MSNNGDIYEQDDRVLLASRWICPECGCKIVECSAKEMLSNMFIHGKKTVMKYNKMGRT